MKSHWLSKRTSEDYGIGFSQFCKQDLVARDFEPLLPRSVWDRGKLQCHPENRLLEEQVSSGDSFSLRSAPLLSRLIRATGTPSSPNSSLPRYCSISDKHRVTAPRNTGQFCKYQSAGRQRSEVKSCRREACQTPQPFNLCMRASKNKSLDKHAWCSR